MRETHRLQLYWIWLNWLELATREVLALEPVQSVPRCLFVEERLRALIVNWQLKGLRLEPEEHSELVDRLAWAHRTLAHAQAAGLDPPEQPLLPWRLHLLLSDWWQVGRGAAYVLDEQAPESSSDGLQFLPAVLHTPLHHWWPRLLQDSPQA